MRGRELKALRLPQLIEEARVRGEADRLASSPPSSSNKFGHSQQVSGSSTISVSDTPSPTFSLWGHSRLGSNASSVASSPPLRDSMDGFGASKRPLTEVKEEPQERESEDQQMVDDMDQAQASTGQLSPRYSDLDWSLDDPQTSHWLENDMVNDAYENDFAPNPIRKRQRANTSPSPFNGLTSRMTSSISRKWKPRKVSPPFPSADISRDPSLSRANSTRAPSFASATLESNKISAHPLPSTPTKSLSDEGATIDIQRSISNHLDNADADDQAKPTTPLLPPLMTHLAEDLQEVPYQSPLQSPSIAEPEPLSALNSPLPTPQLNGLPSPPLSAKPSRTSFQRQRGCTPALPLSEIPPMLIADPNDPWVDKLGHANFTIFPEPYRPSMPDREACDKLRADWKHARHRYAKHLTRTGDNYGPTSEVYSLTEQKWTEISSKWERNMRVCMNSHAIISDPKINICLEQEPATKLPPPLIKMPSLTGPKSEGKFPSIADEGIVGPMEVVAPPNPLLRKESHQPSQQQQQQQQSTPSRKKRKLGFFRWVQGVWPVGAVGVVFGRSTTSGP